ncbi:MAG TPA: hypothetical protein VEK07_24070 [Polyangiaceae bacterium]|nr:hypothetical protein [Polyangiaceae bacterium]
MSRRRGALPVVEVSALGLIAYLVSCGTSSTNGAAPGSMGTGSTSTAGGSATLDGGADAGAYAGVENSTTACTVPDLPGYNALAVDSSLPDPFMSLDGTRITSTSQWTCRRAEIMAQAQLYELGTKPPKPSMVSGSFAPITNSDAGVNGAITVNVSEGGSSTSFTSTVTYPTTGTPPYPAMIGIDGIEIGPAELQALGVALITFPASTVAQQDDTSSRGLGSFYDIYGSDASAGAMMAWAWGVSRLIDVIEQTPSAQIDPARLGVTGCSRDGKGSLIVGAFDERIALTIPQESGSGGAASWRISDYQLANGTVVQTLSEIVTENVWFESSFVQFANSSDKLPFDHHMIEGLVAPRALLVIENTSQVWLGNYSTFNNSMAAHLIWDGLGIPDHMGVSQNGDHAHCVWDGSQQPEVTAYVQKFLVGGGTADTTVLKTDAATYCPESMTCTAYGFDQARWVNWTVPTLQGAPAYDMDAAVTGYYPDATLSEADATTGTDGNADAPAEGPGAAEAAENDGFAAASDAQETDAGAE